MKKIFAVFAAVVLTVPLFFTVSAQTPYETYTYSYDQEYQVSPDAYTPTSSLKSFGEAGKLNRPTDVAVGNNDVYICDTGNNRIVILNENMELLTVIDEFTGDNSLKDSFNTPSGIFVDDNGDIYVADTNNERIVVFGADYSYKRSIPRPSSTVFGSDTEYLPVKVSVDLLGRIFVLSQNTAGVIAMNNDGSFIGFIGAQNVSKNPLKRLFMSFMTEEQLARLEEASPVTYNDLCVDEEGFLYVCSPAGDAYELKTAIRARSSDSSTAVIKKLTSSGVDVMRRNGFFPQVGDLEFDEYKTSNSDKKVKNPSTLGSICIRDNGIYSVADIKYNKIFTYNPDGYLLYAFGGTGEVDGLFSNLTAIAYMGDSILALDSSTGYLTVFSITDYGQLLDKAIECEEKREYSEMISVWKEVEKYNGNFDLALLGIGKSYLKDGNYKAAMKYFRTVNNKQLYSKAMQKQRQLFLEKYALVILLAAVALLWLIIRFFKAAKKYNTAHEISCGKRTVREEIMFAFYLIFHPFNGYWMLKHEKRGSMRSAGIILATAGLTVIISDFCSGYIFKNNSSDYTVLNSLGNLLIPFALWCVSNWCLTSLADGKGNFREICIASSYSLVPIIILILPTALISNLLVADEAIFITYITNFAYIWFGFLMFFGLMTVHDYSFKKNLFVTLAGIAGIAIILFFMLLFFNVSGRVISFFNNIYTEISFRT